MAEERDVSADVAVWRVVLDGQPYKWRPEADGRVEPYGSEPAGWHGGVPAFSLSFSPSRVLSFSSLLLLEPFLIFSINRQPGRV